MSKATGQTDTKGWEMHSKVAIVTGAIAMAIALATGGVVQTVHAGNTAWVVAGDEGPSVGTPAPPGRDGATAPGF
ncbi:hypothetical protein [Streptomyces gobiensis]|uniref:hypothetical protein n=1 Tax=Streptomyces gobiensis TaxID=2875706 RepID=UPI001E2C13B0|nr:hypothetical protein [Streptomyces gobiensis]UGY92402.1 hypothetical protein test1122_12175 [Streptomyces gobiensis]